MSDKLFPTAASDSVAIYDQTFKQVFETARPIKVAVREDIKLMEHPLENGATATDHFVINPVGLELSIIPTRGEYRNVYQRIKQAFLNGELFVVQTKAGVYQNQIIEACPHEEDPELFDTIAIALKMREVQLVVAQYAKLSPKSVRDPAAASTVDRGQQQPTESDSAGSRGSSILFGVFN